MRQKNNFNKYHNQYAIKIGKDNKFYPIYGHYYNNENMFEYKKIINNQIIDDVHYITNKELYLNELNHIITFDTLELLNDFVKKLKL